MNKAVLWFTLLLKLSQLGKFEIGILVVSFCGFIAAALSKQTSFANLIDAMTNPAALIMIGWSFSQDIALSQKMHEGEYFSLLFCRPITRASYVLTKSLVSAIGILVTISAFLFLMLIAELIGQIKPLVLIDGWRALSLVASAWSFGCLMMLLRVLPSRVASFVFVVFVYASLGASTVTFGSKNEFMTSETRYAWELTCDLFRQYFAPAIDLDSVVNSTVFSWTPIVSYTSNWLLYLLGATYILNRREFSYAQD